MSSLLKMKQVAEVLNVSTRQAYKLTERGELPYVTVGIAGKRVREQDLEKYIAEHLTTTAGGD